MKSTVRNKYIHMILDPTYSFLLKHNLHVPLQSKVFHLQPFQLSLYIVNFINRLDSPRPLFRQLIIKIINFIKFSF